jgi:hypothetical protein
VLPKLQKTSHSAVDPHGSSTTSLVFGDMGLCAAIYFANEWQRALARSIARINDLAFPVLEALSSSVGSLERAAFPEWRISLASGDA